MELQTQSSVDFPSEMDRLLKSMAFCYICQLALYLLTFSGDTELNEYTDSLARDPERFSRPHNADTGETILHLLAKEGKVEILENVLEVRKLPVIK